MNILLTNSCNRGCKYCFAIERISHQTPDASPPRPPHEAREISTENFMKAIRFAKKSGQKVVGILGGEPSLHTHFTDLLQLCWD